MGNFSICVRLDQTRARPVIVLLPSSIDSDVHSTEIQVILRKPFGECQYNPLHPDDRAVYRLPARNMDIPGSNCFLLWNRKRAHYGPKPSLPARIVSPQEIDPAVYWIVCQAHMLAATAGARAFSWFRQGSGYPCLRSEIDAAIRIRLFTYCSNQELSFGFAAPFVSGLI